MRIRPFFETGDTEVIIHLIRENKALSFLPYFAVEDSIRRGELRELKVRDFDVTMYRQVFYHKDKWVTNEMREFMNLSSMGLL